MPRLQYALLCLTMPLTSLSPLCGRADEPKREPNPEHNVVSRDVSEDWPRWRGPRGDGTWFGPELPARWPESGLRKVWEQPLGGGYAGVTVAAGRVLTLDRQTEPTERERLLCFDAAAGRLLWKVEWPVTYGDLDYGNGPRAAPTVAGERVYALGALGRLLCVDLGTGRQIWSRHLANDFRGKAPTWGYAASPVILDGRLIVLPGGEGHAVCALAPDSGQLLWSTLSDPAGYSPPILVSHAGHQQLICWSPTHIRSVAPATGAVNWSVPYPVTYGVAIATPVVHRGIVVVCGYWEGSKAVQLGTTPQDHELIWEENRYLRGLMSQPLTRDGYVYLLDKRYGLTCFDIETGRKLWDDGNRMTPRGRNPQASLISLRGGPRTLILNSEGELILAELSPDGYTEQSRTSIIGPTWAHPGLSDSQIFARDDAKIVCFDMLSAADAQSETDAQSGTDAQSEPDAQSR